MMVQGAHMLMHKQKLLLKDISRRYSHSQTGGSEDTQSQEVSLDVVISNNKSN